MTFRKLGFLVALAVSSATFACASSSTSAADDAVPSESELAARSDVQILTNAPEAVLLAKIEEFRMRNGSAWKRPVPALAFNVNALAGTITSMRRTDPPGLDEPLTADEAIERARGFFLLNHDLIGLTPDQIARAAFHAEDVSSPTNAYSWVVRMAGEERQPGYEAFDTVATKIDFSLSIGRDGKARDLGSPFGFVWPKLTLSTTPAHAANDAVIVQNVVGRDLTWYSVDPTPYDNVNDAPAPEHVGVVAAADVSSAKPTIFIRNLLDGASLRLAWDLRVMKNAHEWTFIVDTKTGEVLSDGQSDGSTNP